MNYEEARQRFERDVRPRAGNVLLERNTYLEKCPQPSGAPAYAIRFHGTNVVVLFEDGSMSFDTGGWDSKSTADRMNWASHVRAFRVGIGRPNGGDGHVFVKLGDGWGEGYDRCVRVDPRAYLDPLGVWHDYAETYGDFVERRAEQARQRARDRRVEQHENALDLIVGFPQHARGWWYEQRAGHVRVEGGVLFSGKHPVAVCYPPPDDGVQANLLTVSQRALKRTRVGIELVERAVEAGCKLAFEPHQVVIEEAQNRATSF